MGVMQSSIWVDSEQYYGGDIAVGDACGELGTSGSGENTPLLPSNSNDVNDAATTFSSSSKQWLFSPYASPLAFPILLTTLYQLLFRFSPIGGAANPAMGLARVSGLRQVVSLFGEIYLVFWIGWLASVVGGVGFILGEGGWLDNSIETLVGVLCSCRNNQDGRRRGRHPVRREMNHIAKCHAYTFGFATFFMFLYGSVRELVGRGIYLQNIETWPATQAGTLPLQVSCITGSGDLQSMIDRTNERLAAGDDLVMWSEAAGGYSEVSPDFFEWNSENTGAVVVSAYQPPVGGNTVDTYNAMTIMQNGQEVSTYYKNRPVPLVEPNILPGPTLPNVTSVTFTPKSSSSSGRQPVSLKTSMAICFDFDFSYLFRDASNADIVLGASWYWASIGFMFWEHNIFRAIENGFTIIKCAQDGITGAVDPYGRALAAVPTSDNEVHLMEVPVQNGVFTLFRVCGWVFGWICVFLSPVVLVLFVWEKIRQKKRTSSPSQEAAAPYFRPMS